jgi:hypothetical protein
MGWVNLDHIKIRRKKSFSPFTNFSPFEKFRLAIYQGRRQTCRSCIFALTGLNKMQLRNTDFI